MRKTALFLLCLIMLASLCACKAERATGLETLPSEVLAEMQETPAKGVDTLPPEIATGAKSSPDFGRTSDTSYENDSMGICISLPSEWYIADTAELAEQNHLSESEMESGVMGGKESVCVFSATDNAGTKLEVTVKDLEALYIPNAPGFTYFSVIDFRTENELMESGAENITIEKDITKDVAGSTYDAMTIDYNMDNAPYHVTQIAFPAGTYMYILSVTGDDVPVLPCISSLNPIT